MRIEKVLSINKGIIKSYPQKYIEIKRKKIINKQIDFISDDILLERVKINKLIEDYNKRIKRMSYRTTLQQLKEFERDFNIWLDKVDNLSTEEGNTLKDINNRKHEINKSTNISYSK